MSCNSMDAPSPSSGQEHRACWPGNSGWVPLGDGGRGGRTAQGLGGSHTWDCGNGTLEARWTSWLVQGLYLVRNGRLWVRERQSLQSYKGKFCPAYWAAGQVCEIGQFGKLSPLDSTCTSSSPWHPPGQVPCWGSMLLLPTSGLHCVRLPLTFQGPLHGTLSCSWGLLQLPSRSWGFRH